MIHQIINFKSPFPSLTTQQPLTPSNKTEEFYGINPGDSQRKSVCITRRGYKKTDEEIRNFRNNGTQFKKERFLRQELHDATGHHRQREF